MLRRYRIDLSPLAIGLSLASVITTTANAKPFTYVNARFSTVCTFPDQIFSKRMPEPANGDGQQWLSNDDASLACYGSYNAGDDTPDSLVEQEKSSTEPGSKLTYSKTGKNWAVMSGTKGDNIFYERYVFGKEDVIHAVRIEYPVSLKAKYDPLVRAIAGSLHEASGPHWK